MSKVRILYWDDRNDGLYRLKSWLSEADANSYELCDEQLWSNALQRLREESWDILVSDLRDEEYAPTRRPTFQRAWNECVAQFPELSALLSERNEAFAGLNPDYWQEENLWGVGLVMVAAVRQVPEIFTMSVWLDPVGEQSASPAHQFIISACNAGLLRGGILGKTDSNWSKRRFLAALQTCATRKSSLVPDLYEVVVLEDVDVPGDDGTVRRMMVTIGEKKTKVVSPEIILMGDHANIFDTIVAAEGGVVAGKTLMKVLNDQRKADVGHERLAKEEVSRFLELYKIELMGEKPENINRTMCRRDNDTPCEWLRKGGYPALGEEGYTCFEQTRSRYTMGFCPKFSHKRQPPGTYNTKALDPEQGSHRRKVREIRQMLKPFSSLFESDVAGEKGLIHMLKGKGGGYALAGTVIYKNTPA